MTVKVPCKTCGEPTDYTGTKRCVNCWTVERRLEKYLEFENGRRFVRNMLNNCSIQYEVHLVNEYGQGAWGRHRKPQTAIDRAREEWERALGGRPKKWSVSRVLKFKVLDRIEPRPFRSVRYIAVAIKEKWPEEE